MARVVLQEVISYREYVNEPLEWSVSGLELGQKNLIVGKNSTGKSRVLNVVGGLSKLLLQDRLRFDNGDYDVRFLVDDKIHLRYKLRANNSHVLEERVYLDDEEVLSRDTQSLKLRYVIEKKDIQHEPAQNEVSAAARKDRHQHPFLMFLNEWALSVRHYRFGDKLGQNSLAMRVPGATREQIPDVDDSDPDRVVGIFQTAITEFGKDFEDAVVEDMRSVGFPISEINIGSPDSIAFGVSLNGVPAALGQLAAIGVKEEGVNGILYQTFLSQGMFRALSVIGQVNYSRLSGRGQCVIIDDIGEGLDFERSERLVDLLRSKANDSNFQLILSTNDKFVMNHVPFEEWSVLQRKGSTVSVRNFKNSRKKFEEFKFIGLSNFSFFEMDFVNQESQDNEEPTARKSHNDEQNGDIR